MVKVPVVDAAVPKITDCVAPVPEVFKMVSSRKALAPVIVPVAVCWLVPLKYTRPLLWVKVPELV